MVVAAPAATAARGAVPSAIKITGVDRIGGGGAAHPAGSGVLPPVAAPVLVVAAHQNSNTVQRPKMLLQIKSAKKMSNFRVFHKKLSKTSPAPGT